MTYEVLADEAYERLGVLPMSRFPVAMRDRINTEANEDRPPGRWRSLVGAQIPSRGYFEWFIRRGRDIRKEREPIPPALRAAVIARDGLTCRLCGGAVERSDIHVDHAYPHSLGGPTVLSNLQVTHSRCNLLKGARVQ